MRRFVVVLAVALTGAGVAAADTRRATIEPGWSDYRPVWSPGGRMLVFASGYEPAKSAATYRLGLVPPSGAPPRWLPKPSRWGHSDLSATWSPEGNRLLVSRHVEVDGRTLVVVRDLVNGTEKQLTRPPTRRYARNEDAAGNWSRDGRRIVFLRGESEAEDAIVVSRPDGSDESIVATGAQLGRPVFIGDGSRIAFTRYREGGGQRIVTIAAAGGDERPVTPYGDWTMIDWARDGKRILLLRSGASEHEHLAVVEADGSRLRRLAKGNDGAWSADGSRVVFSCCAPYVQGGVRRGIFVVGADGSSLRRLRATGEAPRLSPDGKWVAFHDRDAVDSRNACHGTSIFVMPSTGGRARQLTNDCRLTGTPRADVLLGTNDRDIIRALGGDDLIRANPGDRIKEYYGRDDNDIIDGGPGNDRIYGARHSDRIFGGPGNDRIFGEGHTDFLSGGPGNDYLSAGDGDERVVAGTGNDTIIVRDFNRDRVSCGAGRDTVTADQRDVVARDCERVQRSRT